MARLPRLTIADLPHHIIQLGNNGADIFIDAQDRETMLGLLREMARSCELAVHAYVLLPSQFHLLATPRTDDGLPRFMQAVGRRYVRYFNDRHGRSGTLWEGRYRGTVLQPSWLLPTMVFMDDSPVRAGLVQRPADWPWSSYAHNAGLRSDALIQPHAVFWELGNTPLRATRRMCRPWKRASAAMTANASASRRCGAGRWAMSNSLPIYNSAPSAA